MGLVCAACVALVLPGGADAKPGYFKSHPFRYAQAHVKGSHGYWLRIEGSRTNVNVTARKGNSSVEYSAHRGRLRKDVIRARLPGVGWVFLRFHEQTRYRSKADNCLGPGSLIRHGYFTGWIRIKGEHGYTSVDSHRAIGKITQDVSEICRGRRSARASGNSKEETLLAVTDRGRGILAFEAEKASPEGEGINSLWFAASLGRERGRMTILNFTYGFTENTQTFEVAESPRSASIDPPSPFSGSATFTMEEPHVFSWLGDLEVELPGIGPVRLAGPRFDSTLCIGRKCKGNAEEFGASFSPVRR